MKKKKVKKWKIFVLVPAFLTVLGLAGRFLLMGGKEIVPAVETAEVMQKDITSSLETSGIIASEKTRVYASAVNAQVGEIPVVLGQSVKKGDYLLAYDTVSLQKNYDIAELQAKAENATASDSLNKSSENAGEMAKSANDIQTLTGQIDALNAEISGLQAQITDNEIKSNNHAQLTGEISALQAEIEAAGVRIAELEAKNAQGILSSKEQDALAKLKTQKESAQKSLKKKEKALKESKGTANALVKIQAVLTQKNNRLAQLTAELSEAQSKNAAAEAGVLSAEARANISYSRQAGKLTLEQSAQDLSKAKAGITADFDGIVTDIQTAAGTMAAEGAPLLTLASADDMCLEISVSKYNLENLKMGQSAAITFQDKEYSGTVSYISKIAQKSESGAAMVTVQIHIDNPDDNLILGLDAKARIDLGTAEDVLSVPISAVNSDTKGDFAYVVENGIVVKKYVTAGMASTEEIEIKDGLTKGEKVITAVDSSIIEGMAVTELAGEDSGASLPDGAQE